jgi:hypothetical protein
MPSEEGAARRVLDKHKEFLPAVLFTDSASEALSKLAASSERASPVAALIFYSQLFQKAWKSPYTDTSFWILFMMRVFHKQLTNPTSSLLEPPELDPFDFSLLYLIQKLGTKVALICKNPDCPARYFFAKKKGQEYCGLDCSNDAQKEIKRRWWEEKGKQRRIEARKEKR